MSIQLQKENDRVRVTIQGNPDWMPTKYRRRQEPTAYVCRITDGERKVFQKREKPKPSAWVEKNRVLSVGPFAGTKWKNSTTPYLADMMDAAFLPFVREVYVCAAPQTAKSSFFDNCTGFITDCEPGPILYVYPDEDTAKKNCKDRILRMIAESTRLRSYLTGVDDDEASKRINLKHMRIEMAWATSATKLGNVTMRYVIFDEVDKYPKTPNKREAGPIALGKARVTWYKYNYKIFIGSTPTIESGEIWIHLTQEAQVVFDFHVVCPDCGGSQKMIFDRISFEGERDPNKMENEKLARYECMFCHSKWSDHKRDFAVRMGKWRARSQITDSRLQIQDVEAKMISLNAKSCAVRPDQEATSEGMELFEYLEKYKPHKIGFHLPSWLSWLVSLSEPAAAFLRGQGDKIALRDFMNKHKAEPWKDYTHERKEDRILALRDDRPRGIVPAGGVVSCLTAAVDTQDFGFWYEIRAWGWGMDMESWQVREGYVTTFGAITQIVFNDRYKDVEGKEYFVRFLVQDSQGHRTSEVYKYAIQHRGLMLPFKGLDYQAQPYSYSNIEFYPGTKIPIPGGVVLLKADVNYYKNQLAGKLEIAPDDPGAWHLQAETTEEWAHQMCAEVVNEKGLWENLNNKPNHAWDCSVLNLVAADLLGLKYLRPPKPNEAKKSPVLSVAKSKFMNS